MKTIVNDFSSGWLSEQLTYVSNVFVRQIFHKIETGCGEKLR